jgi:hypothetical protein
MITFAHNAGSPKTVKIYVLTGLIWIMVLPGVVFLVAAMLRQLQPPQSQPARACGLIVEWLGGHISPLGLGVLFLGLPIFACGMGCRQLWRSWRNNQELRQDISAVVSMLRRHAVTGLLASATLVGALILSFAIVHLIAG